MISLLASPLSACPKTTRIIPNPLAASTPVRWSIRARGFGFEGEKAENASTRELPVSDRDQT
jgi:hypothetical protein